MLGRETIPAGEAEAIARVVGGERGAARGRPTETPVRRQQHPKHHGCVRAEFVVEPDLPAEYRVGLFREPGRTPPGSASRTGAQDDDRRPDAHGMAVKLMGVEGRKVLDAERDATTHDFVMVDNPAFFIRDAAEYAGFSDGGGQGQGARAVARPARPSVPARGTRGC